MKWSMPIILLLCPLALPSFAQDPTPANDSARIASLENLVRAMQANHSEQNTLLVNQVQDLKSELNKARENSREAPISFSLMVLYMFFCGLWAYLAGRSFWLWFFLGILNIFALFLLLMIAGSDWKKRLQAPATAKPIG